ncbi:hypothetical protein P9J64_03250 [Deltaproteobacteria bacterium IMCC39524]|nr:hypothetical protein [Deltaproteobacteria bacterium IMCC39524]
MPSSAAQKQKLLYTFHLKNVLSFAKQPQDECHILSQSLDILKLTEVSQAAEQRRKVFMQSQWESFMETFLNTASGFAISWLVTTWVLPIYGFAVSAGQGFQITCIFTVISILRSYLWRRTFNMIALRR